MTAARPFSELSDTGLLWLINSTVLHPRGFALALHRENGAIVGWSLLGDGTEPWRFEGDSIDRYFADVERLFAESRRTGDAS